MFKFVRLRLAAAIALFVAAAIAAAPVTAAETTICTAEFVIASTTPGTVTSNGSTTHADDSGVGGLFTAGYLAGYTFEGVQDFVIDHATNTANLNGSFTVTGAEGTLALPYLVHVDLSTGAATGRFNSTDGTGDLTAARWSGELTGQIINPSPTTFFVTATGPCRTK